MARRSTYFCLPLISLTLLMASSAFADTVFPISTSDELVDLIRNTGGGSVPDGAVIEMAPGNYVAPEGGFLIFNPNRSFTIRAATPGTVVLNGANSERIFRFIINDPERDGAVVFEGLIFRNGRSSQLAFASAMTLQGAYASFIDCLFEDNASVSTPSGSGAIGVQANSTALFLRTTVRDNTSKTSGAGAVIVGSSTMWCHECQFVRNRNNVTDHIPTATGAGMVVTSGSSVYLSNSRFVGNEAGFGGGGIDAKGSFNDDNPVLIVAANSTFVDNFSKPAPGTTTGSPAVGGVINVEDNTIARFYNSRLLDNSAQFGGAVAVYRATVEIYDSVLRGNFATGRESSNSAPRGGHIFAVSDDGPVDGTNNRPASRVIIRDSLLHGLVTSPRAGSQGAAAHTGGCVYTSGDLFRHLGLGGVPQGGTQEENSARLDIDRTAFVDCDVDNIVANGAFGGGLFSELAIITIDDSLFVDGNADGTDGAGGAAALTRFADATLRNTTFANNASAGRGGALFMLGAEIDVNDCTFVGNRVPGGDAINSRGAAIFTSPQDGAGLGIEGMVRNSLFLANIGLAIHEVDRTDGVGVYNETTYRANEFVGNSFFPLIYRNLLSGLANPNQLNDLIVDRGNGNVTDKAPLGDNGALTDPPVVGQLLAIPPRIIRRTAVGDPVTSTESFLAYAWRGDCAELDGQPLSTGTGLVAAETGVHSLMVFDNPQCSGAPDLDLTDDITQAPTPAATLSADPIMISGGGSSTLTWGTPHGTFIQSALDQGQGVLGTPNGSRTVRPPLTTNYTFFTIAQEGGDFAQVKVYVDEEPDSGLIFADGFESGDTSRWSI